MEAQQQNIIEQQQIIDKDIEHKTLLSLETETKQIKKHKTKPENMTLSHTTQLYILTVFILWVAFITPGGIIYGWVGLLQMLKSERIYSQDCTFPLVDDKCSSRDSKLALVFTIAANMATVGSMIYGFVCDRFGPRANAISGCVIMAGGFLLFGFSSDDFDAFIYGYSLIGIGGLGTFICSFQFPNLYTRNLLVRGTLGALFSTSGLIFTFFTFLYDEYGYTRKQLFTFYACLVAFTGFLVFCLYPDRAYKPGDVCRLPICYWFSSEDQEEQYKTLNNDESEQISTKFAGDLIDSENTSRRRESDEFVKNNSINLSDVEGQLTPEQQLQQSINARTLYEEITDSVTVWMAFWFSFGLLYSNIYQANISTTLDQMGDSNDVLKKIFIFTASLLPIPYALMIDWMQGKWHFAGNIALGTLLLIASYIPLFIHTKWVQLISFIFYACGRSMVTTLMFAFSATHYRADHYGRITAFITLICAIIGCAQIGTTHLGEDVLDQDYTYMNVGMILTLTPFFAFAWLLRKRKM
jgi:MFS family permease